MTYCNLFEIPRVFFGPLIFFPRLPLFLSLCGVCLCSVGLRSPFPPSIRQVKSSVERQRGKADVSDIKKTPPSALTTTKLTWAALEPNPVFRGEKPATNGLNYDTASPHTSELPNEARTKCNLAALREPGTLVV